MDKRILGISWLNGQFKAMALNKGSVLGSWECPEPVRETDDLVAILKEAVQQTRYDGFNVAMVLAHPRLTHQLVEAPPISGRDLELFLERRAHQLKTFDEPPVWSFRPTMPTKGAEGALLHILPQPLLDLLIERCHQAELHLLKMFPALSVLECQFRELLLESNEVALLAGETEGSTNLIIGGKRGQVYLGRTLSTSWGQDPGRITTEINRTILFLKQQFGQAVDSVWLFGPEAESFAHTMTSPIDVPVKASPVERRPFYWIEQGAKLSPKLSENLVSRELQKEPQRRLLLRITSFMVGILVAASVATSAYVEALVRNQEVSYKKIHAKEERQQARKKELEQRQAGFDQRTQLAQLILEQQVPPVPGWFLAYIGQVMPDELVLTEFQVKRAEDLWSIRLAGSVQLSSNPAQSPGSVLAKAVEGLKGQLERGPFHVKITRSSGVEAPPVTAAGAKPPGPTGVGSLPPHSVVRVEKEESTRFYVEGVMR